jgi:hypothetical protein
MAVDFSHEQILALAPDAQVGRAAQGLAAPRHWQCAGRSASAVWGEHQGSGAAPYQVVIDLAGPAYHCTCPSRKQPCKHALGLFLLTAAAPAALAAGEPPGWARDWLAGRAAKADASMAASKAERQTSAASAERGEAQARRAAQRERRVAEAIAALSRWLQDLVRGGLGNLPAQPAAFWEGMARQLVDGQASGLARRVTELPGVVASGGDWPARLLDRLARLHLLCEAFGRLAALPPDVQAEVRGQIGWTQEQASVLAGPTVAGTWLVAGQRVVEEDRLTVRRTWLWDAAQRRSALLLDFAPPGRALETGFPTGSVLAADLAFWPGAFPLRALIAAQRGLAEPSSMAGYPDLATALAAFGAALARNPWLERWLLVCEAVTPARQGEGWLIADCQGGALPLAVSAADGWRLAALSGGRPLALAGEWDGAALQPLSAWAEGGFVPLGGAGALAAAALVAAGGVQDELLAAALLGIGRAALPAPPRDGSPLAALLAQAQRPEQPAEAALLSAAALVGLWRMAGARPMTGIAPPTAAADESVPTCPPRAIAYLGRMLAGEQGAVLPEWLAALAGRGWGLPPRWLPESLDLAATTRSEPLRSAIVAMLGARGRWLARQQPDWAAVLPPETPDTATEIWQTGDRAARLAALCHLRGVAPEAGRALLAAAWEQEAPDDRAAFLPWLSVGLSQADEPFLESCLADRRKEVRAAAADLLARLPGSRWVARMTERLQPLLSAERRLLRGLRVTVKLPEHCDDAMVRDGLAAKPPAGLGERAWWLFQMVAAVPPAVWAGAWRVPPAELIRAAADDENAGALLTGWARAAARSGDGSWAAALLRRYADAPWFFWPADGNRLFLEDMPALLAAVPQDALENWLTGGLSANAATLEPDSLWLQWLRAHRRPWGAPFSEGFLTFVRRIVRRNLEPWRAQAWRPLLADCALFVSPEIVGQAVAFLGDTSWLSAATEPFVATLTFRAEMLAALNEHR